MVDPTGSVRGVAAAERVGSPVARPTGPGFGDLLAEKVSAGGGVRFSGHALQRIEHRGIGLDEASLARLHDGVARLAAKGCRESVVLVDRTAFVVSVPSRTVITAVDSDHMREQVFTNIDSAVIA